MRLVREILGVVCTALCILPNGDLCVPDSGTNEIRRFARDGTELRGATIAGVPSPAGICLTRSGLLAVVCRDECRVRVYTLQGELVTAFGSCGSGEGQFATPAGIALDLAGQLVVCDTGNHRLQVFTEAGAFVRIVGEAAYSRQNAAPDDDYAHFHGPHAVAVHPDTGYYYAVE